MARGGRRARAPPAPALAPRRATLSRRPHDVRRRPRRLGRCATRLRAARSRVAPPPRFAPRAAAVLPLGSRFDESAAAVAAPPSRTPLPGSRPRPARRVARARLRARGRRPTTARSVSTTRLSTTTTTRTPACASTPRTAPPPRPSASRKNKWAVEEGDIAMSPEERVAAAADRGRGDRALGDDDDDDDDDWPPSRRRRRRRRRVGRYEGVGPPRTRRRITKRARRRRRRAFRSKALARNVRDGDRSEEQQKRDSFRKTPRSPPSGPPPLAAAVAQSARTISSRGLRAVTYEKLIKTENQKGQWWLPDAAPEESVPREGASLRSQSPGKTFEGRKLLQPPNRCA